MVSSRTTYSGSKPHPVIYNFPATYLEGDACWFELDDGRAFVYDPGTFKHRLSQYEAEFITANDARALQVIINMGNGIATKQQRSLLARYNERQRLRFFGIQSRKRVREKMRQLGLIK